MKLKTKNQIVLILLLLLLPLSFYWQTYTYDFVNYDDDCYVYDNAMVKDGFSKKVVYWALFSLDVSYWHPLTWLSHMLDCQLFGLHPAGHHVVNVLFHLINGILLFLFLTKCTAKPWESFAVATLFAVHPLNIETVTWISQRKSLLSTFFLLFTLMMYVDWIKTAKASRYWLSLLFFTAGLMSKPMLVTLPFLLLLLDFWPLKRMQGIDQTEGVLNQIAALLTGKWKILLAEKIPFMLLSAVVCVVTIIAQQKVGTVSSLDELPIFTRMANSIVAYATYIVKSLWPFDLAVLYPYSSVISIWKTAAAISFLVIATLFCLKMARKIPAALAGWFWFLGMLVPVIGLVQVGSQSHADRYMYVPMIGLGIFCVWGVNRLTRSLTHKTRINAAMLTSAILFFLILSHMQIGVWQNSITLFRHNLDITPQNCIARKNLLAALNNNKNYSEALYQAKRLLRECPPQLLSNVSLAEAFRGMGLLEEARHYFNKELSQNPENSYALIHLGVMLKNQGKLTEAISYLEKAANQSPAKISALCQLGHTYALLHDSERALESCRNAVSQYPEEPLGHCYLGAVYTEMGRYSDAIAHHEDALMRDPDFPLAHHFIGIAYAKSGKTQGALQHLEKAVSLDPNDVQASLNLGLLLVQTGRFEAAEKTYRNILSRAPASDEVHFHLAMLSTRLKKTSEAVRLYQKAIQLNPRNVASLNNLGQILMQDGRYKEAETYFSQAIAAQPDFVSAHNNLGMVLAAQGKLKKAMEHYRKTIELNPKHAKAYYNLGNVFFVTEDYRSALEAYDSAIAIDPQFSLAKRKRELAIQKLEDINHVPSQTKQMQLK